MLGDPLPLGDDVWWVGKHLDDDTFQSHSYLILAGEDSVLIDPGSPLTIDETLAKVASLTSLDSLRYLVCHHPDPDIAACLGQLSSALPRDDAVVVTEWRARALLKHYGHRFDYWLVEDHGWELGLGPGRSLEFQLTPYLHFPGAFMSFDTRSCTLFSSDVFGGFVAEGAPLIATEIGPALEAMRPFHQHYMPSQALLQGSLARVRSRWPQIRRIAPQHGHVIEAPLVDDAFAGLADLDCGVFALSDGDHELHRLLRLADAKSQLTSSLLAIADPAALVASIDAVLRLTHPGLAAELYIDVPEQGWTRWTTGARLPVDEPPTGASSSVELPGRPAAWLALTFDVESGEHDELVAMLGQLASSIRPSVDQYVARVQDSQRIADLSRASRTDPLTNLGNRRALEAEIPTGAFALVALDIDWFKDVNDVYGHAVGDHVLQAVAGAIRSSIRDGDRAYRLGGEEFLVVAPRSDAEVGADIAERILTAVSSLDLSGRAPRGRVTISAGVVAAATRDELEFAAVAHAADTALYLSKDRGRNRVTVATVPVTAPVPVPVQRRPEAVPPEAVVGAEGLEPPAASL